MNCQRRPYGINPSIPLRISIESSFTISLAEQQYSRPLRYTAVAWPQMGTTLTNFDLHDFNLPSIPISIEEVCHRVISTVNAI